MTCSKIAGQSSRSQPCSVMSGHTPVAMSWSMARTTSTVTPCRRMISMEMSARPWVCDCSGERLSVQLMKSARRSEKSHWLCWQSSSCFGVSVVMPRLLATVCVGTRSPRCRWCYSPLPPSFGAPGPVERDELAEGLGRQVVGVDATERVDRHPQLGQVLGAMRAGREMAFEPGTIASRKCTVEVAGHELDGLAALDRPTPAQEREPHVAPISIARCSRILARPRCSNTRWFPSLTPSKEATSAGPRPSTSRRTTTWRCASGSVGRISRTRCARRSATMRSSTCSDHGTGGVLHAPEPSKRSSTPPSGNDVVRCSRPAVVRARLIRMWNSQVLNEDRPSKRSTPRTTASHVSCTTSSATARLFTTVWARRSSRA